jgi:hypothetical protein
VNRFVFLLAVCCVLIAGCEVSLFGSEPITLAGGTSAGGTASAYSCEEPDAARAARAEADEEEGCVTRCRWEAGEAFECRSAVAREDRSSVIEVDLHDADGLLLTVEVCDPDGVAFQLSDSVSGSSTGGDAGDSAHDADVILVGNTLHVRASSGADTAPSEVREFVTEEGCSTRTLVISEQVAYLVDQERGLCGPGLFRIDPPTDAEGTPDAHWYLGTEGSVDGAAEGSGLRSADFCFW